LNLRNRTALLAAVLAGVALAGCTGDEPDTHEAVKSPAGPELTRVGSYAVGDGALFRIEGESLEALAVLPGAGVASDTLEECRTAIAGLGPARFSGLVPSPDSAWAAWETTGPGACVGVVGPRKPAVRVLGQWSAALPDSLLWAPAARYLAVWLTHPARRRSLWVYDAIAGERLEMPWEADCRYVEDCDVERAVWLGGTLLNVGIRLGPAEHPVPFEVNVAATPPVGTTEEL
jgi:hypothetical protein